MMDEEDIQQRVRYIKAKIRNIPYYWEYDESLGESRSRKQYIHVLRGLRKQLLGLVEETIDEKDLEKFKEIIELIPPKVKTEECKDVILKLKNYVK